MKILIADDDATSRLILQATLRKAGHPDVTAVEDGERAWTAWNAQRHPVLITDWQMPGFDGLQLCRAIRDRSAGSYSYVILLTAHGGRANHREAMDAGVDDFLTKPVDEDALAARLHVAERILGLRRHVKHLEGILSICAYCKKIRDERHRWSQVERYVTEHSEAQFSHGICPECLVRVRQDAGMS